MVEHGGILFGDAYSDNDECGTMMEGSIGDSVYSKSLF
jgi:hypothetical protein